MKEVIRVSLVVLFVLLGGPSESWGEGPYSPPTFEMPQPGLTQVDLDRWYRSQAWRTHPDSGGNPQEFIRMRRVYENYFNPGQSRSPTGPGRAVHGLPGRIPNVRPRGNLGAIGGTGLNATMIFLDAYSAITLPANAEDVGMDVLVENAANPQNLLYQELFFNAYAFQFYGRQQRQAMQHQAPFIHEYLEAEDVIENSVFPEWTRDRISPMGLPYHIVQQRGRGYIDAQLAFKALQSESFQFKYSQMNMDQKVKYYRDMLKSGTCSSEQARPREYPAGGMPIIIKR